MYTNKVSKRKVSVIFPFSQLIHILKLLCGYSTILKKQDDVFLLRYYCDFYKTHSLMLHKTARPLLMGRKNTEI